MTDPGAVRASISPARTYARVSIACCTDFLAFESANFLVLDESHDMEQVRTEHVSPGENTLQLTLPARSVLLIRLE